MKSEDEPITEDEFILRLIRPKLLKPRLPIPIVAEAFRPSSGDDDGISVVREACISTCTEALNLIEDEEKRRGYSIARLRIIDILGLNLTVRPDRHPKVAGHGVIPQMNSVEYPKNKGLLKPIQARLAALASKDIVYRAEA
jgi:hypothetical protein